MHSRLCHDSLTKHASLVLADASPSQETPAELNASPMAMEEQLADEQPAAAASTAAETQDEDITQATEEDVEAPADAEMCDDAETLQGHGIAQSDPS